MFMDSGFRKKSGKDGLSDPYQFVLSIFENLSVFTENDTQQGQVQTSIAIMIETGRLGHSDIDFDENCPFSK